MTPEQISELEAKVSAYQAGNSDWIPINSHQIQDLIATAKEVERLKAERDELVRVALNLIDGYYMHTPKWDDLKEALAKVQK